jgi:hypothetical protein
VIDDEVLVNDAEKKKVSVPLSFIDFHTVIPLQSATYIVSDSTFNRLIVLATNSFSWNNTVLTLTLLLYCLRLRSSQGTVREL